MLDILRAKKMKKLKEISKNYCFRRVITYWLVLYMVILMPAQSLLATPSGGAFQGGDTGAIVDGVVNGLNTVSVNQARSVIHWESLDTSQLETLQFTKGELVDAAVLNRVVGEGTPAPTQFDGTLLGQDMEIFMINQAGIVFGPTAVIDVGVLAASSLDIDDADFRNELPYTFTGGIEAGDVEFYATDVTAEVIALVGKNVLNKGALVADELVIMAAGDSVVISEDGTINVEVDLGGGSVSDFVVNNHADGSGIDVTGDDEDESQVILAAGDIWSAALVKANSEGGSDAVATVTIDAKGDVSITDEVIAEAEAPDNGVDNAIATIEVTAGGDVEVMDNGSSSDASLYAEADDGVLTTATVTVNAQGNVAVKASGEDNSAYIEADTESEGTNTSTVIVNAQGNVEVTAEDTGNGGARIYADAEDGDQSNTTDIQVTAGGDVKVQADASFFTWADAKIKSDADDGVNSTANLKVDAGGNVEVVANHGNAEIKSETEDAQTNSSTLDITTDGGVLVKADSANGITSGAQIVSEAENSINNTALTKIDAGTEVMVLAINGNAAEAEIKAQARNYDIEVDESPLIIPGLTNSATIDIKAKSVEVTADGGAEAKVNSIARNDMDEIDAEGPVEIIVNGDLSNTADTKIETTGTDVVVEENGYEGDADPGEVLVNAEDGSTAWIGAETKNEIYLGDTSYDLDIEFNGSVTNTSNTDIKATDQVMVIADGTDEEGDESEAYIYTEAWNQFENDSSQTVDAEITGDMQNNAETVIDAGDDVDLDSTDNEDEGDDIEVKAEDGGEAYIYAEAWNDLEDEEAIDTLNVTVGGSMANISRVDLTTGDEVWVMAEDNIDGQWSVAGIEAWSENEIDARENDDIGYVVSEGTVNLTVGDSVTNQADVVINAGDNVIIGGDDAAEALIAAWSDNELEGGNVTMVAGAKVSNISKVDITTGDDVEVLADENSDAYITAESGNYIDDESGEILSNTTELIVGGSLDNKADVVIKADEDVELYGEDGGEAAIYAKTINEIYSGEHTDGVLIASGHVDVEVAGDMTNQSGIDITTGLAGNGEGDVDVEAYDEAEAYIQAEAENEFADYSETYFPVPTTVVVDTEGSVENQAVVNIDSVGEVEVIAEYDSSAEIIAEAKNEAQTGGDYMNQAGHVELAADGDLKNEAKVDIKTDNALFVSAYDDSEAEVAGIARNELQDYSERTISFYIEGVGENISEVTVQSDTDVVVNAYDDSSSYINALAQNWLEGESYITAGEAMADASNTAKVDIDAGGIVAVVDNIGEIGMPQTAKIEALAEHATTSNTAEVDITGNMVVALAADGGDARIKARAAYIHTLEEVKDGPALEPDGTENNARVKIDAFAIDLPEPTGDTIDGTMMTLQQSPGSDFDTAFEQLANGSVLVGSINGGDTQVEAVTYGNAGTANTSDVLVCADGALVVGSLACDAVDADTSAEIKALSHFGYSNTSSVGLGAPLAVGAVALGPGSNASVLSKAMYGYTNTADLIACSTGFAGAIGIYGGNAEIASQAAEGEMASADTAVCGDQAVVVGALEPEDMDSHATIGAFASSENSEDETTTADADVVVVSEQGGVAIVDITSTDGLPLPTSGTAEIVSEARGAYTNTANTGISAGGDLYIDEIGSILPEMEMLEGVGVLVAGFGDGSNARIVSEATGGDNSTAETVVCTPADVIVNAEGEFAQAKIKSIARKAMVNTAVTRVFGSEVDIIIPGLYRGNGIWANAGGIEVNPHVPYTGDETDYDPVVGDNLEFIMTEYNGDYGTAELIWTQAEVEGESTASLFIRDYSNAEGCPTCPGCPCGRVDDDVIPIAPLDLFEAVSAEGCPGLTQAAAAELGISPEGLQVAIGGGLAGSPGMQPCQACAGLINAAAILQDPDGSRMAALNEAFNTLAPADVPFNAEMATSIVTALGTAEEGSTYAAAAEYIDAFVLYVAALDQGLGSPVGDSVAYVMDKYGDPLAGSDNENILAFVASRMENMETF